MKLSRRTQLDKQLSRQVMAALNKDENFSDCYQIALNNCKTKPYLVGGKLYRTLIEILYDYPARSRSCDFDFATSSAKKKKQKQKIKKKARYNPLGEVIGYVDVPVFKSGYEGSLKFKTRNGCKIDIINIPDLELPRYKLTSPAIDGYLKSVPLSIQSLAMDIERCEIFGSVGIDSIKERFIWINNKEVLNSYVKTTGKSSHGYIAKKAASIKFKHDNSMQERIVKKYKKAMSGNIFDNYISTASSTISFGATTTTGGGIWYNIAGSTTT